MHTTPDIITKRLRLRQWREEDIEPFSALNADPRVMEYYTAVSSRAESEAFIKGAFEHIQREGWGLWAAALLQTGELIGFIGLDEVPSQMAIAPAIEIGWRLAFKYWGKGYATEGAMAVLQFGFEKLHLPEIVACTAVGNKRSRAVMERIGMHYDPKDDFDHPRVPEGHPLRRHVLYRIKAK